MRSEEEIMKMIERIDNLSLKDCGNDPFFPCCVKTAIVLALEYALGEDIDLEEFVRNHCI